MKHEFILSDQNGNISCAIRATVNNISDRLMVINQLTAKAELRGFASAKITEFDSQLNKVGEYCLNIEG